MQRVLSFEQSPPLSIPLRFFLSAPLFSLGAAALLLWQGPQLLHSRWLPDTLAFTHFLTLGFLAMSMCGALLQILPVVAGVNIPTPVLTARWVHALLAGGTLALCAGFLLAQAWLFRLAMGLLLAGFAWFFIACAWGMLAAQANGAVFKAVRLALGALMLALSLGLTLAACFAWPLALPLLLLTDLHAAWGLIGWVGLLIAGIAFQVVPMFLVTPTYPETVSRLLPPTIAALLGAWSLASAATLFLAQLQGVFSLFLAFALLIFAGVTLNLLRKRKRPKPDPSTWFWYLGMICLATCSSLWMAANLFPGMANDPRYPLLLGVLFMVGFAYSIVNGTLYKIVPFLVWYHLQEKLVRSRGKPPSLKDIISDRDANRQLAAHGAALALMTGAVFLPGWMAHLAGMAFAASSLGLGWNLMRAALLYRSLTETPLPQPMRVQGL